MLNTRNGRARPLTSLPLIALVFLALAFMLVALTGCKSKSGGSTSSSTGPITVTDDNGKSVTLKAPAKRIVSLAPANTEIAFALGAGDKMVGGTTYDDYPAAAKSLPKIGDFNNPNVEKVVNQAPDLVLAAGGIQAILRAKFEKLGIPVFVVDPQTLDQTMTDLTKLGRLMGVSDKADKVVTSMKATIKSVQDKIAAYFARSDVSPEQAKTVKFRPTVFFEVYPKPLMTAGRDTFVNDLITLAGGANIGAAAGPGYPTFSSEVLFEKNPDFYIAPIGSMSDPGQISARPGYNELKAVKDGHVYTIEDDLVVRPGPRLAQGLVEIAKMIHPEAFTNQ